MRLFSEWVTIARDGEEMVGFAARPQGISGVLPGLLVIQEVWGPDAHIQDMANRFAEAGYQVVAPDLYSRGGRPAALAPERIETVKTLMEKMLPSAWQNDQERTAFLQREAGADAAKVGETMGRLFSGTRNTEAMVQDLVAWAEYLTTEKKVTGVASVGYCMGGSLSFLLATQWSELQGAVLYYGSAPDSERMDGIACPVLGFYGGTDHRITDAVPEVKSEMERRGKAFEPHIYPAAGHAFFNDTRASYNVDAARDAWARTLAFFADRLG